MGGEFSKCPTAGIAAFPYKGTEKSDAGWTRTSCVFRIAEIRQMKELSHTMPVVWKCRVRGVHAERSGFWVVPL